MRATWFGPAVLAIAAAALPAPATAAPRITTDPPLQPRFKPAITDYAVRCPDRSVTFGGRGYDGPQSVAIEPGQAVAFRARGEDRGTRHFARCVPDDFPEWTYRHVGRQTPRWYAMTPNINFFDVTRTKRFVAIFDHHGAPVWWYRSSDRITHDARLIDGNIVYAETPPGGAFGWQLSDAYYVRRPDGTLVRTLRTVGVPTDFHDLIPVGRGHLMVAYRPRPHVDLSAYGGPSDATVMDSEIQRVNRRGRLVWSWSSKDHISLDESGRWWPELIQRPVPLRDGTRAYDTTHINSIELAGDDIILSFRNTDAVYRIRMSNGRIRWKLGGTETNRSLRVVGDPADYTLGGQHDARLWKDGTVTISDNGTGLGRAPRALRFAIDAKRRTATLLESITDPRVDRSLCCGSARKLANGDWLIGWGQNGISSLLTPHGELINSFTFDDIFSYRTVSYPERAVSRSDLRDGMDEMYAAGEGG